MEQRKQDGVFFGALYKKSGETATDMGVASAKIEVT